MYIDAQQLFSDTQALVGTAVSTNVIDTGAYGGLGFDRDIGIGTPMCIVIVVKVSPVGGGTLQADLQTDDNVGFASPAIVATTGAIAAALLTAGQKFVLNIPVGKLTERFLRLNYTMVTMTAISITSFLTRLDMVQADNVYNDAINIG